MLFNVYFCVMYCGFLKVTKYFNVIFLFDDHFQPAPYYILRPAYLLNCHRLSCTNMRPFNFHVRYLHSQIG